VEGSGSFEAVAEGSLEVEAAAAASEEVEAAAGLGVVEAAGSEEADEVLAGEAGAEVTD